MTDGPQAQRGLTSAEAATRLRQDGPNVVQREAGIAPWRLLARQFGGPLVWLLIGAAVASAALGERTDAIAIAAILAVNAVIGFFQEYRAERAVHALQALTAPRARVLRDGRSMVMPASEVVVGDVVLLEAGDVVPADGRLIEASALRTSEAALTGESLPVDKSTTPSKPDSPLAEQHDRVFAGTSVATGSGVSLVEATGMATQLGRIASLLQSTTAEETPLQRRLAAVGRTLLMICVGLVALVAAVSLMRGLPPVEVLVSAVSLAVAAVPEGLAAIVTVALALGVQRMAARNVLVRKLPSVETLGSTSVICTDKTGTLTTGVMVVREVWGERDATLRAAAANCDADLGVDELSGSGDPTEVAILLAAVAGGIRREVIERELPRVEVHPFDAERKRMSIFRGDGLLYVKGAPESVLPLCTSLEGEAARVHVDMAARGLRVLAIATGRRREEQELTLLGFVGLADPPRTEAIDAVRLARSAGIRTVMITGDHPATAAAIACEMGILRPGDHTDEVVHARATPEDKLRIVRAWKARGAVVAMTGDGVNDAPALKEAHIGIAMGRTGTEVTREASAMILANDNFASIVDAIREGRAIYDNIRKTLVYLLAGNCAELAVMLGAVAVGLPLPLLPLQLLWVNLVTDGMPALALVVDPPGPDVLARNPRPVGEPILGATQWVRIVSTGLLQATVTLGVYVWALGARDLLEARNLVFSTLVFGEVLRAFAARSDTRTLFESGWLENAWLVGVVIITVLLQLGIHHTPIAQHLFGIGPLSAQDCALSLLLGLVPVTILELSKIVRRGRRPTDVARRHDTQQLVDEPGRVA